MLAGLIQKWDLLEWKITLDSVSISRAASGDADLSDAPSVRIGGGLASTYQDNFESSGGEQVPGIDFRIWILEGLTGPFGDPGTTVTLSIPDLSIDETYEVSEDTEETTVAELIFEDVALYQDSEAWLLLWSGLTVKINSSTVDTFGADSLLGVLLPAGVPLFGVPPELTLTPTLVASEPLPDFTCTWPDGGRVLHVLATLPAYAYSASGSATVSGGWRFYKNGAYHTLPVTLDPLAIPTAACSGSVPTPSISNTYNGSASGSVNFERTFAQIEADWADPGAPSSGHFAIHKATLLYERYGSTVMLHPDPPKGVGRFADADYAALILCGAFPEAKAVSTLVCCRRDKESGCAEIVETTDADESDEEVMFSETDLHLCRVTNDPHEIEDIFDISTYAPYYVFGGSSYTEDLHFNQLGSLIPPDTYTYCYEEPVYHESFFADSQFPDSMTEPSDSFEYLRHAEALQLRYVNFNAHPHASMFYFFPPESDTADWKVNGTKERMDSYWGAIREQWFSYPDIDEGDDTERRNTLLSAPMVGNFPGNFVNEILGCFSAYWGITRFDADTAEPLASVTLDSSSEDLWSATDATLTHGSDITVNPSELTCTVDLDIGSLTEPPYMYPHLCNKITVGWSGGTITAVSVKLVTPEGDEIEIGTAPGVLTRLTGEESKYAGSWKQDFDAGNFVSDEGADSLPAGVSATVMADAERIVAFGLLNTRTAGTLRFEFTVDDHSSDFTLTYPTFTVQDEDATILVENGQSMNILFPNGPGLRYGNWKTIDEGDLETLIDPIVRPPGSNMSVTDWFVWRNLLLEAQAKDTDLNSNITDIYDSQELSGQTGDFVRGIAYIDTHAFLVPGGKAGIGILVNWQREWYPLACWPENARNADWTRDTDVWEQKSYSHAQEPRRLVSGGSEVNLFDTSGPTQWTGASSVTVPGWEIVEHSHAVDNTEMDDFEIRDSNGTVLALVSPWHGYFLCYYLAPPGATAIPSAIAFRNQIMVSWQMEGVLLLQHHPNAAEGTNADWETPYELEESDAEETPFLIASSPFRAEIRYVLSGDNKRRTTTGFGRQGVSNWSASSTPSPDVSPAVSGDVVYFQPGMVRADGAGSLWFSLQRDGRGENWTTEIEIASNHQGTTCGFCALGQGGYGVLYQDADGDTLWKATEDPDAWPIDAAAIDTGLDLPICGLSRLSTGVLFAISWDEGTQETTGILSLDNGATWESLGVISEVPNIEGGCPSLTSDGPRLYIVWIEDDTAQYVRSHNAGSSWS